MKGLDKKVFLCAPTHVAARNLSVDENQGITLQRFWNRYLKQGSGLHAECMVVIDEVSQVSTQMWHCLAPLARLCQVICMGNPEDQLLAVADSWLDQPLQKDVSESPLPRSICGYRRLRLTEGKRSCGDLFSIYSSFSAQGWRSTIA